jgi:hypothetical protein
MLFYDTALLLPAPTLGPLANLRMEQTAADFRNTFRWNCDLRDSRKLKHEEVLLRNFWFRLSGSHQIRGRSVPPLHTTYRPRRALHHDHKRTLVVGQRPLRGERPQHRRLGWRISRIASAGSLVGSCFCRVDL